MLGQCTKHGMHENAQYLHETRLKTLAARCRGTCEVFQALRRALVPSAGCSPHAELPAAIAAPGPHVAGLGQGQRVEVTRRQSRHRLWQIHLLRDLHRGAKQDRGGVLC